MIHDELCGRLSCEDASQDGATQQIKCAYRAPSLQIYGSVKHLTTGSQTVGSDGGVGSTRMQR